MRLSRTDLKSIVDALMFLCVLGLTAIGLLLAFIIPEGPAGGGSAKYFLGVHRHQWSNIHLYLSLAFTAFLVLHIILGWSWIRGKAGKVFGKRWKAALASIVLVAALVPVLFWALASKNDPAYAEFGAGTGRRGGGMGKTEHLPGQVEGPPPAEASEDAGASVEQKPKAGVSSTTEHHEEKTVAGRLAEEPAEFTVTGQMTLADIERGTGISSAEMAAKLGLPSSVSASETLGRLRRRYGFTMEDVRAIVVAGLKAKKD